MSSDGQGNLGLQFYVLEIYESKKTLSLLSWIGAANPEILAKMFKLLLSSQKN